MKLDNFNYAVIGCSKDV